MITNDLIYKHSKNRLEILQKTYNKLPLSNEDWEDFSQDILIHIFNKKQSFKSGNGYKRWLNTIIKNQFINRFRDFQKVIDRRDASISFPDNIVDPKSEYNNLQDCIKNLDEENRAVIEIFLSVDKIADAAKPLGLKIGTSNVYKRWRNIGKTIKENL